MKSFFIILLIIFPAIVFAQANYQPGYILKNSGDTLKGYINYTESSWTPLTIKFKGNKADEAKEFTPQDIKAFQINGFENYVSYIGVISVNQNIVSYSPHGLDTSSIVKAVFLKPIIAGRHISLFYNSEPGKNRFFIAETNGSIEELKYYPYFNDANILVEHFTYRGQLLLYNNKYNGENQQLINKINDVMFTESDLGKIVGLINNNGIDKPIERPYANKRPSAFRFFVGVAINNINNKTTYGGFNPSIPTGSVKNSNTITPAISLGTDFFINPNVRRLILRMELSYSYSNNTVDHSESGPNTSIKSYNLPYTPRTITLTPQVIYNIYNESKLKIYIDGGLSINNSFSSDYNPVVTNESIAGHLYQYASFYADYRLQAGVVLNKKIELSLSFNNSSTYLTTYPDVVNVAKSSTCFSVKYLIGGN